MLIKVGMPPSVATFWATFPSAADAENLLRYLTMGTGASGEIRSTIPAGTGRA
jgi:hypothetical protein